MRRPPLLLIALLTQWAVAPLLVAKSYVPLMDWQQSGHLPGLKLDSALEVKSRSINPAARPQLAGQWPKDVELLQDALLRKHGKLLGGSPSKARQLILDRYSMSSQSAARLRGIFAEAVYLEIHPNEGYVGKPNATHNDVYCWVEGEQLPQGGQIKTTKTFSGADYVAKMKKDYLARRFIVPDDHVEPLKRYLLEQDRKFQKTGDIKLAEQSRRFYAKVKPLGATTSDLEGRLQSVFRRLVAAKSSPYVSLGVAAGVGLAPILWNYMTGEDSAGRAIYQATRATTLMGVGLATDGILANIKGGALRGTAKGNLITGAAIFAAETGFLVYENGGTRAFQEARFWEELGGSASGLTLGLAVGTPVGIWATGAWAAGTGPLAPAAPLVGAGAGLLSGSLAGTAGYFGGKRAARVCLDTFAPEIAHRAEREAVAEIRLSLDVIEQKAFASVTGN